MCHTKSAGASLVITAPLRDLAFGGNNEAEECVRNGKRERERERVRDTEREREERREKSEIS